MHVLRILWIKRKVIFFSNDCQGIMSILICVFFRIVGQLGPYHYNTTSIGHSNNIVTTYCCSELRITNFSSSECIRNLSSFVFFYFLKRHLTVFICFNRQKISNQLFNLNKLLSTPRYLLASFHFPFGEWQKKNFSIVCFWYVCPI